MFNYLFFNYFVNSLIILFIIAYLFNSLIDNKLIWMKEGLNFVKTAKRDDESSHKKENY